MHFLKHKRNQSSLHKCMQYNDHINFESSIQLYFVLPCVPIKEKRRLSVYCTQVQKPMNMKLVLKAHISVHSREIHTVYTVYLIQEFHSISF